MQIRKTTYKDIPALELITGKYLAVILPDEGAKMACFRDLDTGKEYLLQNQGEKYLPLGMVRDYEYCECSGFDDMFPTIDTEEVKNSLGEVLYYPDHGESCRLPFTYEIGENSLTLHRKTSPLGICYEKTLLEGENGGLEIRYAITNITAADLNVLWAAHCLVNAVPGGRVVTPFADGADVDVLDESTGAIPPRTRMPSADWFLVTPEPGETPRTVKLYFTGPCAEGFMGYQYPQGDTFRMTFDPKALPSLGLWCNYGLLNHTWCVGLEPCTVGYDTVLQGKEYGQEQILKSGETLRFALTLSVTKA